MGSYVVGEQSHVHLLLGPRYTPKCPAQGSAQRPGRVHMQVMAGCAWAPWPGGSQSAGLILCTG